MDIEGIMREIQKAWDVISLSQLTQVLYVADKGKNTCNVCGANDGKTFNIEDPNLPQLPIHPNCRCKYVSPYNQNQDISAKVEQYRICQVLIKTHNLSEELANDLAGQVTKARIENDKLREQKLFLLFNGRYFISSNGTLLLDAVSGKALSTDEKINSATTYGLVTSTITIKFDYSYERQGIMNVGSLPQGLYTIACKESGSLANGNYNKHLLKQSAWGDYHWQLIPDENTDTRGRQRNSFTIHGGNTPGSAGCIDLTSGDKQLKQYLDSLNMQSIYVYADYAQETVSVEKNQARSYPIMPRMY